MTQQQPDRTKFLGGSDISAVLGISPWKTPLQLWHDKIEPREEQGGKAARKAKSRGKRWEATVAEMLVEELERQGHTVEIVASNARYKDDAIGYFACEIDFEVKLDGADEITSVELKTVHPFKLSEWGESGTDSAPIWYVAQAMWGLGITKRRRCLIAALFGADELKVYPVDRDDETIAALREKGGKFWTEHVLERVPPPPVKLSDLDILHGKESEAEPLHADDDLTAKVLRLRAIDREMKARTAEYDALEFEIKRAMKEHPELLVNGETSAATWKERPFSYLDQAALKEDQPELHKQYTVKVKRRVFSLKQFSWKGTEE